MKRSWVRWVSWILLTPIVIFILAMVLLYIPPVQNFLRARASAYASEATGMQIEAERIDLRFPLNLKVTGVTVIQQPDTLFRMKELNVRVQLLPLFKGQVEIDNVSLSEVAFNTAGLIDGLFLEGDLGYFFFKSHGVDLPGKQAIINQVKLADANVCLAITDSTSAEDTTSTSPLDWAFLLKDLSVQNVAFRMQIPVDSLELATRLEQLQLHEVQADLGNESYSLRSFRLSGGHLEYDLGTSEPQAGFDASHIRLNNLQLALDSVNYGKRSVKALLRDMRVDERSGLSVTSLTAKIVSDTSVIRIPDLRLTTPNSEINFSAQTYWELIDIPTSGNLTAMLDAHIGRQDVLLFGSGLPEEFRSSYPMHPLVVRAGTTGNLKSMQLSGFKIDLPGAFSIRATGNLFNMTDSLTRSADLNLTMQTGDLNFLAGLTGIRPKTSFVIPDSMNLQAGLRMNGSDLTADLCLEEQEGVVKMDASYNLTTEKYQAMLLVDSIQVDHFLPNDSIYGLSVWAKAEGTGSDIFSAATRAKAQVDLKFLQYGRYRITNVDLETSLLRSIVEARFKSDNPLLRLDASGSYNLAHAYPDGKLDFVLSDINLFELGLLPQPLDRPVQMQFTGEVRRRHVQANLTSGDLSFGMRASSGLNTLLRESEHFAQVLTKQLEQKELDHSVLRKALPTAGFTLDVGTDNVAASYLKQQGISFRDLSVRFGFAPEWGINGLARMHTLKIDTLQLDTLQFTLHQDTTSIRLQSRVVNGPDNPHITFLSKITAEVRDKDAELMLEYQNEQHETGLLVGLRARPWVNSKGESNGFILNVIPEKPVIAYQPFTFPEKHNWAYIHKNMRVYANILMENPQETAIRFQSLPSDTVSLQNIDIELRKIPLAELFEMFPYMPAITGSMTAEAHYIQTENSLQLASEISVDELTYEKQRVGDVTLNASWLPGNDKEQYVAATLSHEQVDVLEANGVLNAGGTDNMEVEIGVRQFPLALAKVFVPEDLLRIQGKLNANLDIQGQTRQPRIEGDLSLDSTWVYIPQADARFSFDNRPIHFSKNKLSFDRYAIYASGNTPFTISGDIDFANLSKPMANLQLLARNYMLLDAKRRRNSLIYGKVFVDLDAFAKGPLDELLVRGNINLLNSTDVTYVLTDSPLTVEDRLSELVTFTSFTDTVADVTEEKTVSLGGLDAIMMIHIDPTVRVGVDLSADRSNRIQLVGGGDLSLQLTPQGDMGLTGRYTLSGGLLKFAPLPVIPSKEFTIDKGSYVDWTGNITDPMLNFKATNRVRTSVALDDGSSRMVDFDVSVIVKNRLENLSLAFGIEAPEDATVQNQLASMGEDKRNIQAIAMLATGFYLADGGKNDFNLSQKMGSALSSVVSSQINALAGNIKGASFSFGMEDHDETDVGGKRTDYSFKYSQRFFNDRFQIVLGGKVSTGENVTNEAESFIDNISFEYRLDASGTRYVRLFYDKNYDSVFEGEITETGVGLVLRKRLNKLGELFIFRRKDE